MFGATRESRGELDALDKSPWAGGELAGVVAADEEGESAPDEDEDDERRRRNENLKVGSKYAGKIGLVAEMPLSRTISAVG